MKSFYDHIWAELFKRPVDDIPDSESNIRGELKYVFLRSEWYDVYDLVEFSVQSGKNGNRGPLLDDYSRVLAEEMAGFRFIDGQLVEITDETEIAAIEDALNITASDHFRPVREQLATSLRLLSDRNAPDYRNSIKEAISAVEGTVQILTEDTKAELGAALKKLRPKAPVHGALKSALLSLCGYTSDADGIRHALTEEADLDAADAKFMLVACSAFVVYLIQKAA